MASVASEHEEEGPRAEIPLAQRVDEENPSVVRVCLPFSADRSSWCCSDLFWQWSDLTFEYIWTEVGVGLFSFFLIPFFIVGLISLIVMGIAGRFTFEPIEINGSDISSRPEIFVNVRVSFVMSILSSFAWVLFPYALLFRIAYSGAEAEDIDSNDDRKRRQRLKKLFRFHRELAWLGLRPSTDWVQNRRESLAAEVERLETLMQEAGQRDAGTRGAVVAEEVVPRANRQFFLAVFAIPLRSTTKLYTNAINRGKLFILVTLLQLSWIPVSFYYYWKREPAATNLEIYLFNFPFVILILCLLLFAGCVVAALVVVSLIILCTRVVLCLLFICCDRATAENIETNVKECFDNTCGIGW